MALAALAALAVAAGAGPASAAALSLPAVVELPTLPADAAAGASSLRVPDLSADGIRTNGRIFGYDPLEGPYSCSGTALATPSHSIVLTAGHCVMDKGVVARDLVFVPGYDHGHRPFGTFSAEAVYAPPQWRQGENPDFDVAAMRVAPGPEGRLTDVVGGRGWAIDRSRHASLQIYGYPAAALRGEELRSCKARGLGSDPFTFGFGGPPTMPSLCDMAAGSSGGPWIVDGEYVDGVTSYGYSGSPNKIYSSYFGDEIGGFLAQLP